MVAPLAVIVTAPPAQTDGLFTVTVGDGFTVKTAVFVLLQPLVVPVTVYVIPLVDVEVTTLPVVALNPVGGDHAYVDAPFAVNVADEPAQTVCALTVIVGIGTTVKVAVAVAEQPLVVPVTE